MKKIILTVMTIHFFSLLAQAEFSQLNLKYLSVYDIETKLSYFFDSAWTKLTPYPDSNRSLEICFSKKENLGFNIPSTGEPKSFFPTTSTIQTLQDCTKSSTQLLLSYQLISNLSYDESKIIYQHLFNTSLDTKLTQDNYKTFADSNYFLIINSELNNQLIDNLVLNFLGTDEVIDSYGLITDKNVFKNYLLSLVDPKDNLTTGTQKIISQLVIRDEFLTY